MEIITYNVCLTTDCRDRKKQTERQSQLTASTTCTVNIANTSTTSNFMKCKDSCLVNSTILKETMKLYWVWWMIFLLFENRVACRSYFSNQFIFANDSHFYVSSDNIRYLNIIENNCTYVRHDIGFASQVSYFSL